VQTPPAHGSATLEALDELIRAAAAVEPAVARRAGLSTSELQALRYLVDVSRGPVELSHLLGVTSAASSGVVDRLAARGHVRRRPHPADGRRTQVEITGSGRQALDSLLEPMQARLAGVDASLGEDERATVGRYLTRVTEVLRATL
jgi:DNA-binding MarR family transcriptional regulator